MREQLTRAKTGAGRKRVLSLVIAGLTVLLTVAAVFLYQYEPSYEPPPFESEAAAGVPEPPDNMRYGEIDAMGKFKFCVAGTIYQQKDGSLKLFFTNLVENEAYLMCEIVDIEKKQTLYRSGLLRPGEYVENLYPLRKIINEAVKVEIYVYAFDPENYTSIGTVTLNNTLQPS